MDTRTQVVLGSGAHRYRVVENWAKLPDGWEFKDVAAVAVDSKDRVYVFNRGEHPMIVFDREGNFIKSWGEGTFPRAHGLHIDANDILYYVKNEWFGSLYPGFPLPFNQRVIMVLEDDYVRAEILLRGLRDEGVPPAAS